MMALTRTLLALLPGAALGIVLLIGAIVPGADQSSSGFTRAGGAGAAVSAASRRAWSSWKLMTT